MLKALKKHKKKLLEYADVYSEKDTDNDITCQTYRAFDAVKQFLKEK